MLKPALVELGPAITTIAAVVAPMAPLGYQFENYCAIHAKEVKL